MKTICECWNCGHRDEYENLPSAKKLRERLIVGDRYTDVECPECGHLCFPDEPPLSKAAPDLLSILSKIIEVETESEKHGLYGISSPLVAEARAAIAKATQKSS